LTATNLQSSY